MPAGSCHARRLSARSAAGKRQQSDIARAFDGHAQSALMPRANAGQATRENLSALLHELRQNVRALVVNEVHLLDTKLADFLLAEILALAAGTSPGPARTARAAFAPRASWAAFPSRSTASAWPRCLFLFLCHAYHPFRLPPRPSRDNSLSKLDPARTYHSTQERVLGDGDCVPSPCFLHKCSF